MRRGEVKYDDGVRAEVEKFRQRAAGLPRRNRTKQLSGDTALVSLIARLHGTEERRGKKKRGGKKTREVEKPTKRERERERFFLIK